jgi:predicted metal-binding membrane protein
VGKNLTVTMFLSGWALMTGVGMVPGTLPVTRLVAVTRGLLQATGFLVGYLSVWLLIGVVGYVVLSPLAQSVRWAGAGAALTAAAAYELSPLKDACLRRCRSPLRVLLGPSLAGGVRHGFDCAGCCAFLMALMVALGLMSLAWVGLLALVVLVQKAAPFGERSPRVLALALATAAVLTWI